MSSIKSMIDQKPVVPAHGPDGKLKERTVAYRPFPTLKIFRDKQRAALGDSIPADAWDCA